MQERPWRPLDHEDLPRLTVFGVADCEDTAIARDRLHALRVPFLDVDLDVDVRAASYVRGLHGGHRITPTVVVGVDEVVVAEPTIEEVDQLAARAWPGLPITRPVLSRLGPDEAGRPIVLAVSRDSPRSVSEPSSEPGDPHRPTSLTGDRRFAAVFVAHDPRCLACLGYAKLLVARSDGMAGSSAVPVVVGWGEVGQVSGWQRHLPGGAVLRADPGGRWRRTVLDRLLGVPGAPGSAVRHADRGVALLLLERDGILRAMATGPDAGHLPAPADVEGWLAHLAAEPAMRRASMGERGPA